MIILSAQFFRRRLVLAAFFLACGLSDCYAQATNADSLRSFLQERLKGPSGEADQTTRYQYAFVDLDGKGKREVVVFVTGNGWCGSGGCTTFVLAAQASSYRVVTRIPISRLPIRLLATRSNGWRDLTVGVKGGGILSGYESALPFDGNSYPTNPSLPPARRLEGTETGETVLPAGGEGILLYR